MSVKLMVAWEAVQGDEVQGASRWQGLQLIKAGGWDSVSRWCFLTASDSTGHCGQMRSSLVGEKTKHTGIPTATHLYALPGEAS